MCGSLPDILQRIDDIRNSDADADILILGALTVISAALPHISGLYDKCEVFPNFFCFITAPAGSGKGRLALCRYLVSPIDDQLLKESNEAKKDYRKKMNEYYAPPGCFPEKPEEPPMRMLILPANSSSTAVYQTLNDNNGCGLIFETEGDTLSANFNTDYGNFVDDIVCLDQDYETAMEILAVLIEHTVVIYEQLPANSSLHGKGKRTSNRLMNLFNALPDEFDKATFKAVAEKMNLNPRSMDRNLSKWRESGLVQEVARGRYRKVDKA